MVASRHSRALTWTLVAALGGGFIVSTPLWLFPRQPGGSAPFGFVVAATAAAALGMGWAFAFLIRGFKAMDEFAQQGARVGWYFGGTAGLALSTPLFAFIGLGGLHWLWPSVPIGRPLQNAFMLGYFLPVLLQVSGAVLVEGWWRLSKR
ncbi:MAG TPA: hypothetical protein VGS12_13020 [Caulobacteraceae bacterium]|nr:hypothetical protein [Caulobacteraceae bacterium]